MLNLRFANIASPQSIINQTHRCAKVAKGRLSRGMQRPPRYLVRAFLNVYRAGNSGRVAHILTASKADTSPATTDGQTVQGRAQHDEASANAYAAASATRAVADNAPAAEVAKTKRVFRRSFWEEGKEVDNTNANKKAPFSKRRGNSNKDRTVVQPAWFKQPEYTVEKLYTEIVGRAEVGDIDTSPLSMMCQLARSPDEARVVLNAFATVRSALVRKGELEPYDTRLASNFVMMIRNSDAVDVLVEALQRATELGLLLSHTKLHELLKYWAANQELAKIEEVISVMPLGGLPYNHDTAYIVVRAAKAVGAMDKAEYYADAMVARQVPLNNATLRLLGRLPPSTASTAPPGAATAGNTST